MQREWSDKGTRNALRKAKDPDKFVKNWGKASAEKQAAKARQTDRLIERLDVVEEPRKEWRLQMEIAVAPGPGPSSRPLAASSSGAARSPRPVDLQVDWGDRVAVTGPNGGGKSTLLAVLLGHLAPDEGTAALGPGVVVGEVDQARSLFAGPTTLHRAFADQVPPGRTPTSARCSRSTASRPTTSDAPAPACPPASAPGRGSRSAGPRRQPARPRRADEPPRPARDRAARAGAGVVPRDGPARQPRPAPARHRARHPTPARRGRPGHGGGPVSTATDVAAVEAEATAALRALVGREDAAFRDGQWEAVADLVVHRRRVLVVQRTGWGKSAVYFVANRAAARARRRPTSSSARCSPWCATRSPRRAARACARER